MSFVSVKPAELEEMFWAYGGASMGGVPENVAAFYTQEFFVAHPGGSGTFRNDAGFLGWLGQVWEMNHKSGMTAMDLVSVGKPLRLSPTHVLVQVEWGARFAKTGDRAIPFRIAYLLEHRGDRWRILGYVSEEDQQTAMRMGGVID